jgi:hypothetical protein
VKSSSHSAPSARARRPELLKLIHRRVHTGLHRWQALTGGTARHAVSGRSFDDLAAEVGAVDAV